MSVWFFPPIFIEWGLNLHRAPPRPRVSPHLGCQGLLRLDMLNDYNNLEYNLDLVHNLRPGYNFMF